MDVLVSTADLKLEYRARMAAPMGEMRSCRCAIGYGGAIAQADKREGDGKTPLGEFTIRQVFVRQDRITLPANCFLKPKLPVFEISPADGWCDDPKSPDYNRHINLSEDYNFRYEKLWREDHLYDLGLVIGHNDSPPRSGLGSCIFVHLMSGDYEPTEGCVSLSQTDLMDLIIELCQANDHGSKTNRLLIR